MDKEEEIELTKERCNWSGGWEEARVVRLQGSKGGDE